jgi:DNA-binding protein HU-beta
MLNKKALAKILARKYGHTYQQAEMIIGHVFDGVEDVLAAGGRLQIHGFGEFAVRKRAARKGVGPRAREPLEIAETVYAKFTMGRRLRRRVREGALKHAETK